MSEAVKVDDLALRDRTCTLGFSWFKSKVSLSHCVFHNTEKVSWVSVILRRMSVQTDISWGTLNQACSCKAVGMLWRNPMSYTILLLECLSTFTTDLSCMRITKFYFLRRGKHPFSCIFPRTVNRTISMERHPLPIQAAKQSMDNSVTPTELNSCVFWKNTRFDPF